MTRRVTKVHFELVAAVLRRARERDGGIPGAKNIIDAIALDFDREFSEMNRQFNSELFLKAAGTLDRS